MDKLLKKLQEVKICEKRTPEMGDFFWSEKDKGQITSVSDRDIVVKFEGSEEEATIPRVDLIWSGANGAWAIRK